MFNEMRSSVASLLHRKPSARIKYTFAAVVFVGLLAHLYIYANRIVNHDGVFALTYSGSTISSGRWFLYILSEIAYIFTNNYVTPWGIGCVTIALYGLSACLIVKSFDIKSKWLCAALGGLLVSFPTVTSNNLYIFTAHYYALACLLVCLSVYIVNKKASLLSVVTGAVLLMLSLGIYQAYLPFALSLYVVLFIMRCLRSEEKIGSIFLTAGTFLGSVVLGLIAYLISNRIAISLSGMAMDTYMGMDSMGSVNLKEMPSIIGQCYRSFINFFFADYCGVNQKGWLQKLMLLGFVFFVAAIGYKMFKNKVGWVKGLLGAAALLVLPIAINAIYIMVHVEKGINTMTVFATVMVLMGPLVITDQLTNVVSDKARRAICLCVLLAVGGVTAYYSNLANETYLSLEYSNMNVNAYFTELAAQIKSLDNFSPDLKVALVGDVMDETFPEIDCDYIIRGTFTPKDLANVYSRQYFMSMHCGYSPEFVEDVDFLEEDTRVQDMPTYPSAGSIQIIDDIVVVKFS